MFRTVIVAGLVMSAGAGAAFAHVSLEIKEAPVDSTYKAIFRVPHGCDGKATTAVRVKVPEGVIDVKPMPKAGWKLETVKGKYAKAYSLWGETVSEGVTEVNWNGGNLPDEFYDEFVLRARLAGDLPAGETLRFPVVQECEGGGTARWIEIPAAGQDEDALEHPAPGLKLLPKK